MSSRFWRLPATLVAAGALVLGAVPAFADNIQNDIGVSGKNVVTYSGSDVQTTINFSVLANNGGVAGCDVSAGNQAVYTVAMTDPQGNQTAANVTSSASTVSFAACATNYPVTFTLKSLGKKVVNLVRVSGPSLNANGAGFNLEAVAPPANTAPVVTVGGVTATSYEFGSVPAAVCNVTDAEDVGESATPSLSAITGSLSAYGLGSQTATCSYTDAGGLNDAESVTYQIVDTTDPVLTSPGDRTIEATGPGGAVDTFSASATDAVDDNVSVVCDPASGSTFPIGPTLVTCTATDVAGNTDSASFTVTVSDGTPPNLSTPGDQTAEATGPSGAVVDYPAATASDLVDGDLTPICTPAAGSTFPVGDTVVSCSVSDSAGNTSTGDFTVTVTDLTPPTVTVPADIEAEATSASGAAVNFSVTASDLVDGDTPVTCDYNDGDTFPVGETTVSCSSTDAHSNTGFGSFKVTVVDTTPPVIDAHADVTAEATGPTGASVEYADPTATDLVDPNPVVSCLPSSPVLVAVGDSQLVTCTATDAADNSSQSTFTLYVVDTTAPVIDPHDDVTVEATSSAGAVATFDNPAANDVVDGLMSTTCSPASGSAFALGGTTVTCSVTDAAGNPADDTTFTVNVVDTTAPVVTVPANITATATSASGATVSYTATATDLVDGAVTPVCSPSSGSNFGPGTTTVSCTATDAAGNTSLPSTFTVTVSFSFNGFFAPVDNNGVLNTIKGGQSVPLKWAIPNGSGGFISSLAVVSGVKQASFTCTAGAPTDDIEAPTSGASGLRYDTTANQYIYNWQSPKGAGSCYKVTVYLTDGSSKSALFKTK